MAYDPKTEQSIVLSKYHHRLLDALRALPDNRRGKRAQLELLIEQAAKKAGVLELHG